jgi:hypothetical protein
MRKRGLAQIELRGRKPEMPVTPHSIEDNEQIQIKSIHPAHHRYSRHRLDQWHLDRQMHVGKATGTDE